MDVMLMAKCRFIIKLNAGNATNEGLNKYEQASFAALT
jgi:hypothetical protein